MLVSFQAACTLTSAGGIRTGVHVLELMLEDFPATNITLTYADGTTASREASDLNPPLCQVKLQVSVDGQSCRFRLHREAFRVLLGLYLVS